MAFPHFTALLQCSQYHFPSCLCLVKSLTVNVPHQALLFWSLLQHVHMHARSKNILDDRHGGGKSFFYRCLGRDPPASRSSGCHRAQTASPDGPHG